MDFLKVIFGNKPLTYEEFVQAVNAHNGNEANRDAQIKIGNLGTGEYVGRGKFEALEAQLTGKQTELDTANSLIEQMKKGAKGNEDLQSKIVQYEKDVAVLQAQLAQTKRDSAVKVALHAEKAVDVDYIMFKLNENLKAQGKTLELDENDHIKGWDDILSGLKTQLPTQFETSAHPKVEVNKLPDAATGVSGITRSDFLKKSYAERAAFAKDNPDAYKTIMGH